MSRCNADLVAFCGLPKRRGARGASDAVMRRMPAFDILRWSRGPGPLRLGNSFLDAGHCEVAIQEIDDTRRDVGRTNAFAFEIVGAITEAL